jgi:8-oxo-dGTP pyrophosphatase MutT (NUDIX family)
MRKTLKFEYVNYKGERKIREVIPKKIVYGITPHISEPEWLLEAIDIVKNEKRLFVINHIQRMIDEHIQRFCCVTIYVINDNNKFLLLSHRKLGKWLPPGGKVDNFETPAEAAIRECVEETGVKIQLLGEIPNVIGGEITPLGIQLNTIESGKREHVDIIYLGKAENEQHISFSDREALDCGWFSLEEIKKMNTFSSVIYWCEKILRNITNL